MDSNGRKRGRFRKPNPRYNICDYDLGFCDNGDGNVDAGGADGVGSEQLGERETVSQLARRGRHQAHPVVSPVASPVVSSSVPQVSPVASQVVSSGGPQACPVLISGGPRASPVVISGGLQASHVGVFRIVQW